QHLNHVVENHDAYAVFLEELVHAKADRFSRANDLLALHAAGAIHYKAKVELRPLAGTAWLGRNNADQQVRHALPVGGVEPAFANDFKSRFTVQLALSLSRRPAEVLNGAQDSAAQPLPVLGIFRRAVILADVDFQPRLYFITRPGVVWCIASGCELTRRSLGRGTWPPVCRWLEQRLEVLRSGITGQVRFGCAPGIQQLLQLSVCFSFDQFSDVLYRQMIRLK